MLLEPQEEIVLVRVTGLTGQQLASAGQDLLMRTYPPKAGTIDV